MNNTEYWTAENFYKRLDFYLNEKGWNYNRLSTESDISVSMLYEMRRKHYLPRIKNLCAICDALEITVNEFFDVEESYDLKDLAIELNDLSPSQLCAIRRLIALFKKQV